MPSGETARRKLKYLKPTDAPKISEETEVLANALDNDCETFQVKKASERPAAKLRGRLCYVEEGTEKGLWWDTGATWVAANALLAEQVEEGNIKNLAVTEAKIAAKAVSDSKVAANRALVTTNNSYSHSSTTPGTKIEPSATRMAYVTITVEMFSSFGKIQAFNGTVYVGGNEVGKLGGELREPAEGKPNFYTMSFFVPPGQKWEFGGFFGEIQENRVEYSTLLL